MSMAMVAKQLVYKNIQQVHTSSCMYVVKYKWVRDFSYCAVIMQQCKHTCTNIHMYIYVQQYK